MGFHEQPVVEDLRRFIDGVWLSAPAGDGGPVESAIVPDGCIEIVTTVAGDVVFGNAAARGPAVCIVGLTSRPLVVRYANGTRFAGVRLTPLGAARLFGDAASSLAGIAADADGVLGAKARPIAGAARAFAESRVSGDAHDSAAIEDVLRRLFAAAPPLDRRLERALLLLHGGPAPRPIGVVARAAGISTRHLDRGFARFVGVSPKRLARVARFRRAFELGMAARRGDWAAIAARCGYADQAHLAREFRVFAGAPPETMRAAMAASGTTAG